MTFNPFVVAYLIVWLIFTEVIYILVSTQCSKKEVRELWILNKVMSMIMGLILTAVLFLFGAILFQIAKQTSAEGFLLGSIACIALCLFFFINRLIGLKVARGKK